MNEHNKTSQKEKEIWSLTYYGVDKIDEIYYKLSVLTEGYGFTLDESIAALREEYDERRRESERKSERRESN